MAAFGIGAAIAAFASGNFDKSKNRIASLIIGGGLVVYLLPLEIMLITFLY